MTKITARELVAWIKKNKTNYSKAELSSVAGGIMKLRNSRDILAKIPKNLITNKQVKALKELSEIIPKANLQLSMDLAQFQKQNKTKALVSKNNYAVFEGNHSVTMERKTYRY